MIFDEKFLYLFCINVTASLEEDNGENIATNLKFFVIETHG
jgi:hypothetical protein